MAHYPARQLALDLPHVESFAREDFLVGPSNRAALATIERWPDWPAPVLALVGPEGSGKSHLAAIWAAEAGARFLSGAALQQASPPAALATGALVLEDLGGGGLAGADERALFHLLNLAREEAGFMLLTSTSAPTSWSTSIPDLTSRLRSIPVLRLSAPDDSLLRAVLVKLFTDRQLLVDESLIGFLVTRIDRSLRAARAAVAHLDQESLRLRRPVNRMLAAELFRGPAEADGSGRDGADMAP